MIRVSYIACYITPLLNLHCPIRGRFLARFLGPVGAVIGPALLSATLQSLCGPLASVGNASLTLLIGLSDCDSACLPPAITPHPGVDLIKLAAIACPFAASSHCCLAATKAFVARDLHVKEA